MLIKINICQLWEKCEGKYVVKFIFIFIAAIFFREKIFFFRVVFFTLEHFFLVWEKSIFLVLCQGVCVFFTSSAVHIFFLDISFLCWKGCINFEGFLRLFITSWYIFFCWWKFIYCFVVQFIWVPDFRLMVKLIKYIQQWM